MHVEPILVDQVVALEGSGEVGKTLPPDQARQDSTPTSYSQPDVRRFEGLQEELMRRSLVLVPVVVALLATGCGSDDATLSPAAAVRAAAEKATTGSSKMDIAVDTKAQDQDIKLSGTGAFRYAGSDVVGSMRLTLGAVNIEQRITGGNLYLQVPGQPGFYKIALADLAGTQLADSSNPASAAGILQAVGDDVKKVGTEKIRGAETTHYTATMTVAEAAARIKDGSIAGLSLEKLKESGVTKIPMDVFVDKDGRLRRLLQRLTLTIKGVKADVSTRLDFYDFGTKVDVKVPPADQIKDGSAILSVLKSQLGSP